MSNSFLLTCVMCLCVLVSRDDCAFATLSVLNGLMDELVQSRAEERRALANEALRAARGPVAVYCSPLDSDRES
jgi:hypothetical protein